MQVFWTERSVLGGRAPMSKKAPPGKAGPNPYEHLAAQQAASGDRPTVPKLALTGQTPSPPPWPKVPYQGPPGPAEWVQAVHERLRPGRESLPRVESGRPETEDAVNQLGRVLAQSRTAERGEPASSASKAGMPPVRLSDVMEVQNTYHREVGAAFQSGFEPQRHSTFVLGRPVQVGLSLLPPPHLGLVQNLSKGVACPKMCSPHVGTAQPIVPRCWR